MEWQPIETAPRDGTVILGWRYGPVAIRWANDGDYPWHAVHLSGMCHFMENGFRRGMLYPLSYGGGAGFRIYCGMKCGVDFIAACGILSLML